MIHSFRASRSADDSQSGHDEWVVNEVRTGRWGDVASAPGLDEFGQLIYFFALRDLRVR